MANTVLSALRRIIGFEGLDATDEVVEEIGKDILGQSKDEIKDALTKLSGGDLSSRRALVYARALSLLAEHTQGNLGVFRVPFSLIYDFTKQSFKIPLLKCSHTRFKKTLDTMYERWRAMPGNSGGSIEDFIRQHNLDFPAPYSAANPPTFEQLRDSPQLFLMVKRNELTQTAHVLKILLGDDYTAYIEMVRRPLKRNNWFGIDKLIRHTEPAADALDDVVETVLDASSLRTKIMEALTFLETIGAETILDLPPGLLTKLKAPGRFPGIPTDTPHTEYYKGFKEFLEGQGVNINGEITDYFSYLMTYNIQWLFRYYSPRWNLADLDTSHVSKLFGARRLDSLMATKEILSCILLLYKEADTILKVSARQDIDIHKVMLDYFFLEGSADIFEKMFRRQNMEHGYLFEVRTALVALIHFPAEKILLQSRIGNRCAADLIILAQRVRRQTQLVGETLTTLMEGAGEVAVLVQMKSVGRFNDLLRFKELDDVTIANGEIIRQLRSDVTRLLIGFLEGPDALPLGIIEGFSNVIVFKVDWHRVITTVPELKIREIRKVLESSGFVPANIRSKIDDLSNYELLYATDPEVLSYIQAAFKKVYLIGDGTSMGALEKLNRAVAEFENDLIRELMQNADEAAKTPDEIIKALTDKFDLHLPADQLDFGDEFYEILDILKADDAADNLKAVEQKIRMHFRNRFNCNPENPLQVDIDFLGHSARDAETFLGGTN